MANNSSTGSTSGSGGDAQSLKQDAAQLKDKATSRLAEEADTRKDQVAGGMKQVSSALDSAAADLDGGETPDWLRQGVQRLASSVGSLASELESTDSRELTRKVKDFARRSPGTFLGACAAAGFAASRVFTAGQSGGSASGSRSAQSFGGGSTGVRQSASGRSYGQDSSYGAGSTGGVGTATAMGTTGGSTVKPLGDAS